MIAQRRLGEGILCLYVCEEVLTFVLLYKSYRFESSVGSCAWEGVGLYK